MIRLKELRIEKGMKQAELAELLNVTRQAVSRYEAEERDISPETIRLLCNYFGVTADYLLGISSRRSAEISDADADLVAAYHSAPQSVQAGIDALLQPYQKNKEITAAG